jgi:hypothetical protein
MGGHFWTLWRFSRPLSGRQVDYQPLHAPAFGRLQPDLLHIDHGPGELLAILYTIRQTHGFMGMKYPYLEG